MSAVVGIDLSSFAVDLVRLDETSNTAEWTRVELPAAPKKARDPAWHRTLALPALMPKSQWWDDVYLVAIEAPYGSNQGGTQAILNRVVGAIMASIPAQLRQANTCWIVRPDEWKTALGLKGKPTVDELGVSLEDQNARDAYCLALYARQENLNVAKPPSTNVSTLTLDL